MLIIKKLYSLTSALGLAHEERLAIVGCGGKTSAMYRLAEENRDKAVLITTTTRILRPSKNVFDYSVLQDEIGGKFRRKQGVTLFYGGEENSKLLSPCPDELLHAQSLFDCVFIEADGSKNLPLKGWNKCEPVIPEFVTATLAVAVPTPIGENLSEKNTHRLPVFCALTGANAGETITAEHIAKMICSPHGMLQKSRGKRILFINQVETEKTLVQARGILDCMPKTFLQSLSRVVAGSVRLGEYIVIREGNADES